MIAGSFSSSLPWSALNLETEVYCPHGMSACNSVTKVDYIIIPNSTISYIYESRSKFIVYVKCRVSCFYIFWQFLYLCLSIFLKRVHLDPHPWRFLFARVGAHLCFCPPVWSSFALLGRSLQPAGLLERKWVLACFGHSQLLTSKFELPI